MIVREPVSPNFLAVPDLPVIGFHNFGFSAPGLITASDEAAAFPASNLSNPSTHLRWIESGASPAPDVEFAMVIPPFDAGSPTIYAAVEYVAIAAHNFGTLGCTLTLSEWDFASSPDVLTPIMEHSPTDDSPIILQFASRGVAGLILELSAPTLSPTNRNMGILYYGNLITLERGVRADVTHVPVNLGRNATVFNGFSESGNFLGRLLRNSVNESRAEFMHFRESWYRQNFDPFLIAADTLPFFFAWSPDERPTDLGFCWLTRPAIPEFNPQTLRFNCTLEMRGLA